MADILTQLQDALDILLEQFYAGLMYTSTRHPYADIPGQPHDADRDLQNPSAAENGPDNSQGPGGNGGNSGENSRPRSPPPDPNFAATQHEISSDIIMNMARIQALIDRLPGVGFSEKEQVARMQELDRELREEEGRLQEAVREKDRLLAQLDERIMKVRRP